ncbi:MAG: DUF748 domain-containing protein [Elusimicrobia bacterium]|nr:DUF748 domain-containing protein [Elusimicrobiota bacterium]
MSFTRHIPKRWGRWLGLAAVVYGFFALTAWWGVPFAIRRVLREVPKALPGFAARVAEAKFDPLRLALTLRGLAFSHEKLGDLATCEEIRASLQPLDLLRLAAGLRELRLTRPRLIATIAADGRSVLDYLPKTAPAASTEAARAPFIPRLVVHHFEIDRAALEFESLLPNAPQKVSAYPIDFALDNLSTLPGSEGSHEITARTNHGETLRWSGRLTLRPARLEGRISANNLDASRESTAAPGLPVEIPSGRVDAATDYELVLADGVLTATLSGARLAVRELFWNPRASGAAPRGPFSIAAGPARLELRLPLASARGAKAALSINSPVAEQGAFMLKAAVAPRPLSGHAELRLTRLPLAPFTPLAPPPTQVAIDSGCVSLEARVTISSGGAGLAANASLALEGFSLSDSASRRTLVKLDRFTIENARASTRNRTASIERIRLLRPYLRVFRGRDGRTNVETALGVSLSSAVAAPAGAPSPARRAAAPWRAKLGRFALAGGKAVAQDESVAPAFTLTVQEASAELSGLATDGRSTATFAARGRVEKAPFSVTGGVRLASAAAWIDASVKAEGIQLTAFTPYAIKTIGYKLDQGTLNLDLRESLAERRIESANKVVIDQLTLGEKVDSPDALKIPVKLGLAILKDRRGVIDLDVPVSGSLDDPEFRLAPLIIKTLINLVVKAAVSPFAALGKAFGGGEDLGHVAFAPGEAALAPAAAAGLDRVAQALAERPALFIGVRGGADRTDALALGDLALRRRLRGPETGDAALTPREEKKVLAFYEKTFGAAGGAEARAKLAQSLAPGEAELRALAIARAGAVQEYLTGKGVAADRFFSLEPAAGAPCELQLDVR